MAMSVTSTIEYLDRRGFAKGEGGESQDDRQGHFDKGVVDDVPQDEGPHQA